MEVVRSERTLPLCEMLLALYTRAEPERAKAIDDSRKHLFSRIERESL
jgi:hypothetical protein